MKAYELLEKPESWVQWTMAVDRDGDSCGYLCDHAARFCLLGALHRVYDGSAFGMHPIKAKVARAIGVEPDQLAEWNDQGHRTHAEVIEALRKADV